MNIDSIHRGNQMDFDFQESMLQLNPCHCPDDLFDILLSKNRNQSGIEEEIFDEERRGRNSIGTQEGLETQDTEKESSTNILQPPVCPLTSKSTSRKTDQNGIKKINYKGNQALKEMKLDKYFKEKKFCNKNFLIMCFQIASFKERLLQFEEKFEEKLNKLDKSDDSLKQLVEQSREALQTYKRDGEISACKCLFAYKKSTGKKFHAACRQLEDFNQLLKLNF